MMCRRSLSAVALAAFLGLTAAGPAAAHDSMAGQPYHYGWHQGWHMDPGSMMQGCPMGGPGTMSQGMTGPGTMGPGMMNPGMMNPDMMHPGMIDQGMMMLPQGRPSMVGPRGMEQGLRGGMMMQPAVEAASVEDVTRLLQQRLDWQGNPHVKLGKVEAKNDDTVLAEIVTQDGSLVERLEIDRRSGWMRMVP